MVRKRENRDKHSRKHIYFCGMVGFDIALYDFFIDFGLFFLATIAGVPAGIAGAFISVGAIFQGVFSPIVGHISDRSTAKAGRRRSYMLWGVLVSVAALMILFVPLPDIDALKIVFFGIATLAFWIMYTVFYTPFLAFGGECAKTYDDRTLLRTVVTIANNAGDIILTVMTTGAVAVFVGFGISRHNSWCMATAIFCFFCVLFVLLGYRLTKGYDTVIPKEEKQEKLHIGAEMKQIYESYKDMLKIRSLRILIAVIFFSITAYTMKEMGFMFVMTYNAGLSESQIVIVYVAITVLGTIVYPIITKFICDFLEKKGAYLFCSIMFIVPAIYFAMAGVHDFKDVMILQLTSMFVLSGYWQIVPAMLYDINEVDMYLNGQEREGTLMAIQGFMEPVAAAIGAAITGVFLGAFGFDEAQQIQSDFAEKGILMTNTILPAIFFLVACVFLWVYPVTKKRHERLTEAVQKGVRASDNDPEYEDLKVIR